MNGDIKRTLKFINGGKLCFGCGACAAACPLKGLRMIVDADGFAYPRIDFSLCRNCGKCRMACPVNFDDVLPKGDSEFFTVRHQSRDIRGANTSGGAFTALSDVVLSRGGAVVGAVWGPGFSVHHAVAFDAAGRDAMRGSKYVQSDSTGVFPEVRRILDEGGEVLFSGTPCQVAALYSFMGGRPERLTTMDFICHGVPSPLVFQDYLREMEKRQGASIASVRCRDQRLGSVPMRMGIDFADGSSYLDDCEHDPYFRLYLSGIINRRTCSQCPYARLRRGSDLTVADNWRFAVLVPEWDDNTGVSTVLVNTPRGRALLERAADGLEIRTCRLQDVDQPCLHYPSDEHPDRELFFRAWRKRGFWAAADDFTRPRSLLRRLRSRLLKIGNALLGGKAVRA